MKKHFEQIMVVWTVVVIATIAVATTFLLVNILGAKYNNNETNDVVQTVTMAAITATQEPTSTPGGSAFEVDEDMQDDTSLSDDTLYNCDFAYTVSRVYFRSQPSTNGVIIKKLPINTKVTIVKKENDTWAKVRYQGTTGYISRELLSQTEPTVTPVPTSSSTKKPVVTAKPKKTPRPTKKPTPKPKRTTSPTSVPTQEPIIDEATGEAVPSTDNAVN